MLIHVSSGLPSGLEAQRDKGSAADLLQLIACSGETQHLPRPAQSTRPARRGVDST